MEHVLARTPVGQPQQREHYDVLVRRPHVSRFPEDEVRLGDVLREGLDAAHFFQTERQEKETADYHEEALENGRVGGRHAPREETVKDHAARGREDDGRLRDFEHGRKRHRKRVDRVPGEERVENDPERRRQEPKAEAVTRLEELGHRRDPQPPEAWDEDQRARGGDHVSRPGDEQHRDPASGVCRGRGAHEVDRGHVRGHHRARDHPLVERPPREEEVLVLLDVAAQVDTESHRTYEIAEDYERVDTHGCSSLPLCLPPPGRATSEVSPE